MYNIVVIYNINKPVLNKVYSMINLRMTTDTLFVVIYFFDFSMPFELMGI